MAKVRKKPGNSQKGSQALSAGTGKMLKSDKGMKQVANTPGGKGKGRAPKRQRPYSQ